MLIPRFPLHKVLFSISSSSIISTPWSLALLTTMQRQEHLPDTHCNHHAQSDIFFQGAYCQFHPSLHNLLCNAEVGDRLLNLSDTSVVSKPELMNLPLGVSPSLLRAFVCSESANELASIIHSLDLDCQLLSTQVTDLNRLLAISNHIAKKQRQYWPIANFLRNEHDVFTVSVVVQTK